MSDEKRIKGHWVGKGKVYHRNVEIDGVLHRGVRVGDEPFTIPAARAYWAWFAGDFVPANKSDVKAFETRKRKEEAAANARLLGLDKVDLIGRLEALVDSDEGARARLKSLLFGNEEPAKGSK